MSRTLRSTQLAPLQVFLTVARHRSFSKAAVETGVSRAAVSKTVRLLEEQLRVVLLHRTTRSVSLTDAGRRLLEEAGPAVDQALAAIGNVSVEAGETAGRLRISAPHMAVRFVLAPLLPVFQARHPRIELEVVVDDRFVDVVADGYDAGIRLTEAIERDMVQVKLTNAFRFVVVGAPSYFERNGTPKRPEDLLTHNCVTFRAQSSGALYAWELERGRKNWRVPVRGGLVTNDGELMIGQAEAGAALAYTFEPQIREQLDSGRLQVVLEAYAPTVPGFFLYFPSRARRSGPLQLFLNLANELLVRRPLTR